MSSFLRHCIFFFSIIVFLPPFSFGRDWSLNPAIVYLDQAERIVVTGDIHGALPQLIASLKAANLIDRSGERSEYSWSGGRAVWLSVGDYCDRGKFSRQVFEFLEKMRKQAKQAGGKVVSLIGNHEVMLLGGDVLRRAKSRRKKARLYKRTVDSMTSSGKSFEYITGPDGPVGKAIRLMPLMAIVRGRIGFIHAGFANPVRRQELEHSFRKAVEVEQWRSGIFDPNTEASARPSPLYVRNWWNDDKLVSSILSSLQIEELVFGHTPTALVSKKLLGRYERVSFYLNSQKQRLTPKRLKRVERILKSIGKRINAEGGRILSNGRLFNVDIGMCPYYGMSQGGCLEILFRTDQAAVFTAIYPGGEREILKSDPIVGRYEEARLEQIVR